MTLPFTLPAPLPGYALGEYPFARVESHGSDAVELLLPQFRTPLVEALVRALAGGVQDIDDMTWRVLTERSLDTAAGAQLDTIGAVVDLTRAGWDDETYRTLLRAQILVLRSTGSWPEYFAVLAVVGVDTSLVSFVEYQPAAAVVALGAPPPIEVAFVFGLLERLRPACIRHALEWPVADADETFTWADGDVEQADLMRGWADDGETYGGRWADVLATTETT